MDVCQDITEIRVTPCHKKIARDTDKGKTIGLDSLNIDGLAKYSLSSNSKQRKLHHSEKYLRQSFINIILYVIECTGPSIQKYLKLYSYIKNRNAINKKCPLLDNDKPENSHHKQSQFNCIPMKFSNYKHVKEINVYIRDDDQENDQIKNLLRKQDGSFVPRNDKSEDVVAKQTEMKAMDKEVNFVKHKVKITNEDVDDALNSLAKCHLVDQEKTHPLNTTHDVGTPSKISDKHNKGGKKTHPSSFDVVLHKVNFHLHQDQTVFMLPTSHPVAVLGIPWNMLNREINRILTFANYPPGAVKSCLLLAAEGFVYIGTGQGSDDRVKCYFCCGEKSNWTTLEVIREVHMRVSPGCPMVTGDDCDNVSISAASHLSDQSPLEPRGNSNNQNELTIAVDNILTLPPPPLCPMPQAANFPTSNFLMSMNGIQTDSVLDITQTTPDTRAREVSMSTTVPRVSLAEQSIGRHIGYQASDNVAVHEHQTRASSPDVNQTWRPQSSTTEISTNSTLPVQVSRGDNRRTTATQPPRTVSQPQEATTGNLMNSFTPAVTSATNSSGRQLAPNSSGTENSLRNGSRNNPPSYNELGIITERPKRPEYALTIKRYETFSTWPQHHSLSPTYLAEAGFYYAGYGDCARCFYCGGGLKNWEDEDDVLVEHARWFPKCAYIRQKMGQNFVDAVQEINKQFAQISLNMVKEKLGVSYGTFLDMKEAFLLKDPALTAVIDCGYNEKDAVEMAKLIKDEGNFLSADAILERLNEEGRQKITHNNNLALSSGSSLEHDKELMQRLKERNNQLRQQTVCKICMDKEVTIVFLPCGHLISCAECASAMKDCPLCRVTVKGIVRAFIN